MIEDLSNLLKQANISLLLDSYDAIFSDFDPRPYSERTISDDFLIEAQKVVRENDSGLFELRFLIPKSLQDLHSETAIKERLHHHFRKSVENLESAQKKIVRKGIVLTIFGVMLMFIVSLISNFNSSSFWLDFVRVVFEPGGWFMAWYGLDLIFYSSKEKSQDLDFFRKMSKVHLSFDVY